MLDKVSMVPDWPPPCRRHVTTYRAVSCLRFGAGLCSCRILKCNPNPAFIASVWLQPASVNRCGENVTSKGGRSFVWNARQ